MTTTSRLTRAAAFAAALLAAALAAHAERVDPRRLPEQATMAPLPAPTGPRLWLSDPAMNHLVDGRMHLLDGGKLGFVAMLGSGYAGLVQLSRDGRWVYVATTYHSRLQRGTRTDVVEVYRSADLTLSHEIEIPPKRTQGLQIKALTTVSADDRFLFVQNATPATSITVVDLQARRVTAEIENPGCWGVLPWPGNARRISSVCGDGTTTTYDLDAGGALAATHAGPAFFDADRDPVFIHYESLGDRFVFVSFAGMVHTVRPVDSALVPDGQPWSLMSAAERRQGWRPGGFQLFAIDPNGKRLVVAMHEGGGEGSHKNPASKLWVYDLAKRQRSGRLPGHTALSMSFGPPSAPDLLYVLSAADNRIVRLDFGGPGLPSKVQRSDPIGETPVYLVLQ
ncbi:amine dehydrogenase large subunit [Azohydromonas sp.]|uniref:amine dehydrogenase large subunit n=1 Tax=Azohydromonas sp. TaxID=1872666 RepID=UPI002CAE1DBC|nr:amine dehydrogenase large subunit [Azohydromonas sp.]HMM86249.1 amine dehydrogenase large subunit [Azohydromonas sp.]